MCVNCKSGGKPIAALVARVSTLGQTELSLDSQEAEVRPWLKGQGYEVPDEYVLKFHWTSQELLDCPHIERLLEWVRKGEIHAVGAYHEDRLAGSPSDVWGIYGEFERRKVPLLYKASPRLEGIGGEIQTTFLAAYKRWQVYRARAGAKDGMRDKARLKGLPPTGRKPLGYEWRIDSSKYTLVPTSDWMIVERNWREYLAAGTIRSVASSLTQDGIPTPRGRQTWKPSTIAGILKNPVYAGRYYALRWENTEPKQRKVPHSYGRSSVRKRAGAWPWEKDGDASSGDDGAVLLDGVTVERPVVSWEEFLWVQDRLSKNQQEASRRAKGQYILRGMIFCMTCNKRMGGHRAKVRGYHIYSCPDCQRNRIGPKLEERVWSRVTDLLQHPETILSVVTDLEGLQRERVETLNEQFQALAKKEALTQTAEQEAFRVLVRGSVRREIYDRELALLKAERTWIGEERARIHSKLAALEQVTTVGRRLEEIHTLVGGRLTGADAKERRFVLECLSSRVCVWPDRIEVEVAVPKAVANSVSTTACYFA